MTTIAADTWGIPGPAFAGLYPVLVVAVAIVVFVGRRHADGSRHAAPGATLTPNELAYLRGGDRLAVAAAMGQLRAAGNLDAKARPVGTSMSKDRLDVAVLQVLHDVDSRKRPRQVRSREVASVATRSPVQGALAVMRTDLQTRGFVRSAVQNTASRGWSLLLWGVVILGVARIVAGLQNDKPVAFVVFETLIAFVVAVAVSRAGGSSQTAAARAALADARRRNAHLDPKLTPSWTTYGAAGAGLSIALFGVGALLISEPAFADTVAANKVAATTGGGGGYGGGGSDGGGGGGGSSCGGGGGSCGGGGGCGGGGCGG